AVAAGDASHRVRPGRLRHRAFHRSFRRAARAVAHRGDQLPRSCAVQGVATRIMQRIDLDFAASSRRSQLAGTVLFAVALAVAADSGWSYVHAKRTIAQAETIIARAQPR